MAAKHFKEFTSDDRDKLAEALLDKVARLRFGAAIGYDFDHWKACSGGGKANYATLVTYLVQLCTNEKERDKTVAEVAVALAGKRGAEGVIATHEMIDPSIVSAAASSASSSTSSSSTGAFVRHLNCHN